jgi:hypothetical protein
MVYPTSLYRIVIGGTIFAETWNTSLAVAPGFLDKPSDASILATVASATATWFTSVTTTGAKFTPRAALTSVKVNRINPSGHYQDDNAMTHVYPSPLIGGGTVSSHPPQNAIVVTLRTAFDRGLANRGRMYLPMADGYNSLGTDGRAPVGDAVRMASSVSSLINNYNAAFLAWAGGGDAGHVSVFSNVGSGAFHHVTAVKAGRVVDTMRSRRSSMVEDYQSSSIAIS